jgi:hypothetical protein
MINITPVFRMTAKENAEHVGWKVFDDTPPHYHSYGIYPGYPQAKEVALDLGVILYDGRTPIKCNAVFVSEDENWIGDVLEHWRKIYCRILTWDAIACFTTQELTDWIHEQRVSGSGRIYRETRKDRDLSPITIARLMMAEAERQLAAKEKGACDDCTLPTECCAACERIA